MNAPFFAGRTEAWSALGSLLTSSTTLVCCALPAVLVGIGAGAVLSSLVSAVPQLVWLSEHKTAVFTAAGVMLALAGWVQWRSRRTPCPTDPALRMQCLRVRRTSAVIWSANALLFALGAFFAFVAPVLLV